MIGGVGPEFEPRFDSPDWSKVLWVTAEVSRQRLSTAAKIRLGSMGLLHDVD
jgi:hypothetical protein